MTFSVERDAARLIRHWNDELPVGSQSVPLGRLQVHADQQVIEPAPHWPREVGVLYGVKELGLIHVATKGVGHAVVAQSAHAAVEFQSVVVERQQVHTL